MKSKVKLSVFCIATTYAVIILMAIGIAATWGERYDSLILLIMLLLLIGFSLYYYPRSIVSTDASVVIHRTYSRRSIAYSEIKHIKRCYPSAGGLRLCGSGGFFGYWGYFTDIIIGNYFGYYGDRSQWILIRLTDGKQYVVSCENPDEMMKSIEKHLQ